MNTIDWSAIITGLINTLLPILVMWLVGAVALLVGKVAPIISEKIHASFTSDQIAQAKAIAGVAVTYAEQVWKRDDVQTKKQIAEQYVTDALFRHGIHISASDIEAVIESAVFKELNQGKLLEVKTDDVKIAPATVTTLPVEQAVADPRGTPQHSGGVTSTWGDEGHTLTPPEGS